MGLEQADPEVRQRLRQGKVLLAKITTNKRMEARNLGVSDTTVGRWCDVSNLNDNMPWSLLPLHSAADEMLSALAHERGMVLVDLMEIGELNGELGDERDQLLIHLGVLTEKLRKFMNDRRTPGRITVGEAFDLRPIVEAMKRLTVTMDGELQKIISGDRDL